MIEAGKQVGIEYTLTLDEPAMFLAIIINEALYVVLSLIFYGPVS